MKKVVIYIPMNCGGFDGVVHMKCQPQVMPSSLDCKQFMMLINSHWFPWKVFFFSNGQAHFWTPIGNHLFWYICLFISWALTQIFFFIDTMDKTHSQIDWTLTFRSRNNYFQENVIMLHDKQFPNFTINELHLITWRIKKQRF